MQKMELLRNLKTSIFQSERLDYVLLKYITGIESNLNLCWFGLNFQHLHAMLKLGEL